MASCRRILLSIPSNFLPLYLNWAIPLRDAFQRAGADCILYPQGAHPVTEAVLLDTFRPDCVMSINQFRSQVMADKKNITHILWLQDDYFSGMDFAHPPPHIASDVVYYVNKNMQQYLAHISAKVSDVLMFAADKARCGFSLQAYDSDFSFIGYIPSRDIFTTDFDLGNGYSIRPLELFAYMIKQSQINLDRHPEDMLPIIDGFLKQLAIPHHFSQEKLSFVREYVARGYFRWRNILLAMEVSNSIRLFGMADWITWPEFEPLYCGESWALDSAVKIFRSSRINLHNGGTVAHPRVFECLGSGGFMLANRVRREEGGATPFINGEHLVAYDHENFKEVARQYLRDKSARDCIARNAANFILSAHTWDHRVSQILKQVDGL